MALKAKGNIETLWSHTLIQVFYQLLSVHMGKWLEPKMFNSYNEVNTMKAK